MQPVSRSNQTAYKWGEGGIGWPLVDTDGLLVVEETMRLAVVKSATITTKQLNVFTFLRALR